MPRARTDIADISADLLRDLGAVRADLDARGALAADSPLADAFAGVETFCAIALRVLAKTNPSKLRSEAITVEIQSLMSKPA